MEKSELNFRLIEKAEDLKPGTVCIFTEGHACAFGVIAKRKPWVDLVAATEEYPKEKLMEIENGKDPGYCIVVLGTLYRANAYGTKEAELGVLRPRRFVHYCIGNAWSFGGPGFQSLFVCDNLAMLKLLLHFRMFDNKRAGSYFESVKHDLSWLMDFLNNDKTPHCHSKHGDYLKNIFKKCIR